LRFICFEIRADYNLGVAKIAEIEKLTQVLSDDERAVLAAHLLGSLPRYSTTRMRA